MAKNKIIALYVLLLISGVVVSFQRPSLERIINSQVGVQEQPKGSNWGPQVSRYLRSVGWKQPAPWCAAFVHYCLDSAGIRNTVTAASPTAHNKNYIIYSGGHQVQPIQSGDVFTLYYPSLGRIAHTGFVSRQINRAIVQTIEGNSNADGSREGYITCRRKRSVHTLYSITRW